ncbi:hypothetical protein [Sporosarcina sp. OR05]|uniref:hypothetical protein n=1 Tax=Sporosarcina sp. OR05 TaxID=2969819 RepID=UPI00352AB3BF
MVVRIVKVIDRSSKLNDRIEKVIDRSEKMIDRTLEEVRMLHFWPATNDLYESPKTNCKTDVMER